MTNNQRVPLAEGSKSKDYYKYYLREMLPVSDDIKKILENGSKDPKDALPIENRNQLLDPGYLPDEVGYYMLDNGSAVVSNNTKFHDSTGEMLQWWMAWHSLDPLRYAIWDPFDHYNTEITEETRNKVLNPNVSIPEKCFNVQNICTESLIPGEDPVPIKLDFRDPKEMGFDKDKLGTEALSYITCANGEILTPEDQDNFPILMVHTARNIEGGCELRSRFWFGYKIVNGEVQYKLPQDFQVPEEMVKSLLWHNAFEYPNLAEILPDVYSENKDHWV